MSRSPLLLRLSVRLYGGFTRLYPSEFRRRYGRDMTTTFQQWATDEWQRRRWLGLFAVWFRAIVDLVRSAAAEHVARMRDGTAMATEALRSPTANQAVRRRWLIALGVGFAAINCLLWYATPALRSAVDAAAGRLDAPDRPFIVRGVQELLVYFDPWLAWYVFPIVFTLGFALIPFVSRPGNSRFGKPATVPVSVRFAPMLMLLLEAVWLTLIWIGVWCRGPHWNFYWPGEIWDANRVESLQLVDLSEFFWTRLLDSPIGEMSWFLRELPGLLILVAYFWVGLLMLMRGRPRKMRLLPAVVPAIVLLLALAIPTKICCRTLCDLRYVVSIPELHLNI